MLGVIVPALAQTKKGYKKPVKKTYYKKRPKAVYKSVPNATQPKNITETTIVEEQLEDKNIVEQPIVKEEDPMVQIEKVGKIVEKKSGFIKNRNSVYEKGIIGYIKGIYTNNNKIYFLFELKNTSNIDYEIDGAFFNTAPIKKKEENIELEEKVFNPIWDNKVEVLKKKSWTRLVFAFDKFTLNNNKVLNFNLREKEGEREINLIIKPANIIKAEYIRTKQLKN